MTPAIKALVYANVGVYALTFITANLLRQRFLIDWFGLIPEQTIENFQVWRLATYLFLHDPFSPIHIVFNMLSLWMFGVDLERRWGSRGFLKYYAVTGVGAGIATVLVSLLPFDVTAPIYESNTIGASGAIYGLLLAFALLFPYRQILFLFIFPLPVRVAAALMALMSFMAATSTTNSSVAEATHLAGFIIGWAYLKGFSRLRLDFSYRLAKWRMDRARKKFNIHKGGRGGDWGDRIH
jgi:membrane associated rhomboid family serine protease